MKRACLTAAKVGAAAAAAVADAWPFKSPFLARFADCFEIIGRNVYRLRRAMQGSGIDVNAVVARRSLRHVWNFGNRLIFSIGTPFPLYHPPTFQILKHVLLQYLVLAADFLADLLFFRERRSSVLGVCALAEMDSREKDQRLAVIRMVYCIVLYWKHCWGVSLLVQARPAILHLYNKDRPSAAKQGSICGVPARITRCDAD
jgi:hypothetical protein